MASIRLCFTAYAAASAAALWLLLLHTWMRCDEFYAAVASLTTSKIALAVSDSPPTVDSLKRLKVVNLDVDSNWRFLSMYSLHCMRMRFGPSSCGKETGG